MAFVKKQAIEKGTAQETIANEREEARKALREAGHPTSIEFYTLATVEGESVLHVNLMDMPAAQREGLLAYLEAQSIRHTIADKVEHDLAFVANAIVSVKEVGKGDKKRLQGRIIYNVNDRKASIPGLSGNSMVNGNVFPDQGAISVVPDAESCQRIWDAKKALDAQAGRASADDDDK